MSTTHNLKTPYYVNQFTMVDGVTHVRAGRLLKNVTPLKRGYFRMECSDTGEVATVKGTELTLVKVKPDSRIYVRHLVTVKDDAGQLKPLVREGWLLLGYNKNEEEVPIVLAETGKVVMAKLSELQLQYEDVVE